MPCRHELFINTVEFVVSFYGYFDPGRSVNFLSKFESFYQFNLDVSINIKLLSSGSLY